jgi:hypothetical protein
MYKQLFTKRLYDDDDICPKCNEYSNLIYIHRIKNPLTHTLCGKCYNELNNITKTSFDNIVEIEAIRTYGFESYNIKQSPACFICDSELRNNYYGSEFYSERWYYGYKLLDSKLKICEECYSKLN